jgi:hypothetical protein
VTATNGFTTSGFAAAPGAGTVGDPAAADADADAGALSAAAPAMSVQIVNIDTSILTVATPPPDAAAGAVVVPPPIDLSAIKDTEPPVLALKGAPFMRATQTAVFPDPCATAFDNIDGSAVSPRAKLAACRRPDGVEDLPPGDARPLTCNATAYAAVNTTAVTSGWVWVFTYTAKDAAGNAAAPLRRYVEVTSRCARSQC